MAIGTGMIVRKPWMTSKPTRAGMPSRLPSMVARCSRLISAASIKNSNEPTPLRAIAASTISGWLGAPSPAWSRMKSM